MITVYGFYPREFVHPLFRANSFPPKPPDPGAGDVVCGTRIYARTSA